MTSNWLSSVQLSWEVLRLSTLVASRFAARCTASWIARSSTGWLFAARLFAAAVDDVVAAEFQSLLSLTTDTFVAVSQGAGQSGNDFWSAAAAVLASLIADFISSLTTDAVVSIVESVDESSHDFRVALAVVLVTDFVDGVSTVLSIASRL